MKICYIISTPSVAGGANRSLLDMIRQLQKMDNSYSAIAILSNHGTMEEELKNNGVKCYIETYANSVKSQQVWRTIGKRIYNIFAGNKIREIYRIEKPDIIHNNSFPTTIGMEIAMKEKIPYISHMRENIWEGLGMEFYAPGKVKTVLNKASCVIAISDYILNSYKGFCNNTNTVILNDGIVIEDYYSPNRDILRNKTVRVLIVGVINPQKGQKEAVEAIELLKHKTISVELTVLGYKGRWKERTEYADNLMAYVDEKKLTNIHFIEPINDLEELKNLRSTYDINLICSSAEGLGRTTIESMLSGALTIAAKAGATPEIVTHKQNGLLYERGNIQQLAELIEWAIDHREEGRTIAKNGQKYASEKYSIQNYANNINQIYQDIIKAKTRHS